MELQPGTKAFNDHIEQTIREVPEPGQLRDRVARYVRPLHPNLSDSEFQATTTQTLLKTMGIFARSVDADGFPARIFPSDHSLEHQLSGIGRVVALYSAEDLPGNPDTFAQILSSLITADRRFFGVRTAGSTSVEEYTKNAKFIDPFLVSVFQIPLSERRDILIAPDLAYSGQTPTEEENEFPDLELPAGGEYAWMAHANTLGFTIDDTQVEALSDIGGHFYHNWLERIGNEKLDRHQKLGLGSLAFADAYTLVRTSLFDVKSKERSLAVEDRMNERVDQVALLSSVFFDDVRISNSDEITKDELKVELKKKFDTNSLRLFTKPEWDDPANWDNMMQFLNKQTIYSDYVKEQMGASLPPSDKRYLYEPTIDYALAMTYMAKTGDLSVMDADFMDKMAKYYLDRDTKFVIEHNAEEPDEPAYPIIRMANYQLVGKIAEYLYSTLITENHNMVEQSVNNELLDASNWSWYEWASGSLENIFETSIAMVGSLQQRIGNKI